MGCRIWGLGLWVSDSQNGVTYVHALYACLICMPYMHAVYACLICMPYMHALYACLICMPYVHALYACLICMPYMHALYACLICMPYMVYVCCIYMEYVGFELTGWWYEVRDTRRCLGPPLCLFRGTYKAYA